MLNVYFTVLALVEAFNINTKLICHENVLTSRLSAVRTVSNIKKRASILSKGSSELISKHLKFSQGELDLCNYKSTIKIS